MTKGHSNYRKSSEQEHDWDDGYDYTGHPKLRRNKIDGVLGGICAGFGDYFGLDHLVVRLLFILSVIFLGIPFFAYFILWIFVPSDKRAPYRREYREARRARYEKPRRRQRYTDYEEAENFPARQSTASFSDVQSKFRSLETRLQDLERSVTSKEWRLNRDFRDL